MVRAALSFSTLEFVDLALVRLDKLGFVDAEIFVQYFPQFLSEDDRNGACVLGVYGDRERTGIAVVAVNRAVSFPNAVSVSGRMTVVANEKNFGPEILVERVLGF